MHSYISTSVPQFSNVSIVFLSSKEDNKKEKEPQEGTEDLSEAVVTKTSDSNKKETSLIEPKKVNEEKLDDSDDEDLFEPDRRYLQKSNHKINDDDDYDIMDPDLYP